MDLENFEPEQQHQILAWAANESDKNFKIVYEFRAAAAPIVERLEKWASKPGAHFVVCSKMWESSPPDRIPSKYRYTIRAYNPADISGGKQSTQGKPRESFGFEINFYQNGAVDVQKYYNDRLENGLSPKQRRTERLYKANLRRFDLGWFGLGKIMPEKTDEIEIAFAVRRGLISSGLFDPYQI